MSVQELEQTVREAADALGSAVKAFEAGRGTAAVADLVKMGNAVTSNTRTLERATRELADFELVGIYEAVKAGVRKLVESNKALGPGEVETLQGKGVSTVTIVVPLLANSVDHDRVSVNTLGKRTRVAATGGGNGARAKWHMVNDASSESMECRDFLEKYGEQAFGADAKVTAQMVLDAPAKYGLSDYAARAGAKLDPTWTRTQKDA